MKAARQVLNLRKPEKGEHETCTREAASKRQETLEAQKAEFFANGGKIEEVASIGMESNYKVRRNF